MNILQKRIEQMWREWHDSGDIGVFEDLEKIVDEAKKDLLDDAAYATKFTPPLIILSKEKFEKWFGE